jgi:hypothetical protein
VCPEPWKGAGRGSGRGLLIPARYIFDKINISLDHIIKKLRLYFKNIVSRGALWFNIAANRINK